MTVLFPNADLRVKVRAHPFARDAHGQPIATGDPAWGEARRGSVVATGAGGLDPSNAEVYSLRLDPAQWPLAVGDEVEASLDAGETFVLAITEVKLNGIAGWPDAPVTHVKASGLRTTPRVQ